MEAKKIGLSLGGGGAKGSYQIGVFRAFEENNLLDQIDVVSGTSIGAINALLLVSGKSHDEIIKIWKKVNNDNIYGDGIDRFRDDKKGLYSLNPLFEIVKEEVSREEIFNSKIDVYLTACKIINPNIRLNQIRKSNLEVRYFKANKFNSPHKAALASASIPFLFGPTSIYGHEYVDGGVLDMYSIKPLVDSGCDLILTVPLDSFFDFKDYSHHKLPIYDFGLSKEFKRLHTLDLIDGIRFTPERMLERYALGYLAGLKMIENLRFLNLINENNKFTINENLNNVSLTVQEQKDIISRAEEIQNDLI